MVDQKLNYLNHQVNCKFKKIVCIEYPGLVKNVNNMLETLGGLDQLTKSCSDNFLRLQLRFRPKDPHSHSAFGDRCQTNSLLVKTLKKKIFYSDGSFEFKYETKLIGIIILTYKFKSLADFQYLPKARINYKEQNLVNKVFMNVQQNINNLNLDNNNEDLLKNFSNKFIKEKPFYKSIVNEILPQDPLDGTLKFFNEEAPLFLMPIIFSRFDSPSEYFYKNESKHRDKEITEEVERQNQLSIIGRNRKSRSLFAVLINWGEPVPSESKISLNEQIDEEVLKIVEQDFNKQPIWSRNELLFRHQNFKNDLRFILRMLAYYYTSGPFRGQWIRFGYDPSKDKSSAIYQTLDLRLRHLLNKKLGKEKTTKKLYQIPIKNININEKKTKIVKIDNTFTNFSENVDLNKDKKKEDSKHLSYKFEVGKLPPFKQTFYQLKNIELDEVKEILNNLNINTKDTCDEKDGWFNVGLIDKIRFIMCNYIDQLLSNKSEASISNLIENKNDIEKEIDKDVEDFEDETLDYLM